MTVALQKTAVRRPPGAVAGDEDRRAAVSCFTARRHRTIDAVEPLWRRFQSGDISTVYQRLDWSRAVAKHLVDPAVAELVLVEIVDSRLGASVMLLPLVLRRLKTHTVIEWLDMGVCDYAAPLVAPGYEVHRDDLQAIWTAACSAMPKADLIHISRIANKVGGAPNPLAALQSSRPMAMQAFGVAIDGAAETVVPRVCGTSTHRDIRKAKRRMEARGETRFLAARTAEEIETLFKVLIRQRLERFRDLGRFDLLNQKEVRDFYLDAARGALSGGPARLFGIQVGETWVASAYGLVHHGAFHGTILAMAGEDWRKCSPGLTIITEIMVWARREGLTYLDFTIGDMPYKSGFGVEGRPLFEICEALTLRGRLVTGMGAAAGALRAQVTRHPKVFETVRAGIQRYRRLMHRDRKGG